jgi:hypothetical protein
MLSFSENGKRFAEFINCFDNFRAGLSKLVPIYVCILSNGLNDRIEVLFDGGDIDLAHVEKKIIL